MVRSLRGRGLTVLALLTCLAVGAVAMAAGDDRASAEALLKEVDASPRKDAAGDLVARSRAALDRGARLRSSGDEAHAKLADTLARTWAEAARDFVRAAVVEESAAVARTGAIDAGVVADRERALLEEAIAQSGRVRAQLESAEHDTKEPARTSTTAASADAGVHAPPKPPPSSKAGGSPTTPSPKTNADGGAR